MKRPSLALAVAASALVLTAGLAACGDDDDETTGGGGGDGGAAQIDLTVGNLVPLTGDLSDFGPAGRKAADLAAQEINAAIKQAGVEHTVEVVTEDAPDTQGAYAGSSQGDL